MEGIVFRLGHRGCGVSSMPATFGKVKARVGYLPRAPARPIGLFFLSEFFSSCVWPLTIFVGQDICSMSLLATLISDLEQPQVRQRVE